MNEDLTLHYQFRDGHFEKTATTQRARTINDSEHTDGGGEELPILDGRQYSFKKQHTSGYAFSQADNAGAK